jgi:S1-C subfamily serine protease
MGPGNRHDDEPLDEHNDESDDELGEGLDEEHIGPRGALPDPLDRVWLHPTELSSLGAAFAPSRPAAATGGSRHRPVTWIAPLLAGAAGALLTVAVLAVTGSFDRSSPTPGSTLLATDQPSRVTTAAETLVRLGPSVVAVYARDSQGSRRGSGVCVRHGTQLLTSMRVVGSATSVEVVTADGRRHTAHVVGRDRVTDLVLLDLRDGNLPAADLADHAPATGASVWVVGAPAPGAKSPWMSDGMASSNDALVVSDVGPTASGLLETNAASNTAVMGGALVNSSGSVAGIVVGHVNGSATTYAVSIDVAVDVAREIDATGVATHGSLGVGGVDTQFGPMVASMGANTPAAKAGVRVKDLVEAIDGRPVESIGDVTALVHSHQPGQTVVVELRRGDDRLSLTVTLGSTTG